MSKPNSVGHWLCALLWAIALFSWVSMGPVAAAQLPHTSTPTPTDTPTPSLTPTREATDTPTATHTLTPQPTEPPTNTDTPTPVPPTLTHTATFPPPASSPTATTQPTSQPTSGPTAQPNPSCQSAVEGTVLGDASQPVSGATVTIQRDGWSGAILTDDEGRYGFAGLCAGNATFQAVLPDGRSTDSVGVSLSGNDTLNVTLSVVSAPAGPTTTGQAAGEQSPSDATATPEPAMPTTGSASWLLIGGGSLGLMLLLSAGVRRLLLAPVKRDR